MRLSIAMPTIGTPKNKTASARAMLPQLVNFNKAIINAANAASVVAGFHMGDVDLIGQGMNDLIVEPVRKNLIPGYDEVKKAALEAGASGFAISGAGPAVIAVINNLKTSAKDVANTMKEVFQEIGISCNVCCSKPSSVGTIEV
jgi:homoserine kinase